MEEDEESIDLAAWMKWLQKSNESGGYSPTQINEITKRAEKEVELPWQRLGEEERRY